MENLAHKADDTTRDNPWPVRVLSEKVHGYIGRMPQVWVSGQLVELKRRSARGLSFATLRDDEADVSLPITCLGGVLDGAGPGLDEGSSVTALVKAEFWSRRGSLQFRAQEMVLRGEGGLHAQIELLKKRLFEEGLLAQDRKRRLPVLPRVVGLVCGRKSAAEKDVVVSATTRWPGVQFRIMEVPVQGPTAAKAVAEATATLDADPEVDVIIISRGGGSLEDLLPFSDEGLVRAVAACNTPTVSAIGHEVDSPVLDLVADVRALTPTDAGRKVVPSLDEELHRLEVARARLAQPVVDLVTREKAWLQSWRERPVLRNPVSVVERQAERLGHARSAMRASVNARLSHSGLEVRSLRDRVRSLSPTATLQRGYAVVRSGDELVQAQHATVGQSLRITVADGILTADVTDVSPTNDDTPRS